MAPVIPGSMLGVDTILCKILCNMAEDAGQAPEPEYSIYSYDTKCDRWNDMELYGNAFIPQQMTYLGESFFIVITAR